MTLTMKEEITDRYLENVKNSLWITAKKLDKISDPRATRFLDLAFRFGDSHRDTSLHLQSKGMSEYKLD